MSATDAILRFFDAEAFNAGVPRFPETMQIPRWTKAFVVLFQVFVVVLIAGALNLFGLTGTRVADISPQVTRIDVKDCHARFLSGCPEPGVTKRFTYATFVTAVESTHAVAVDGSNSHRCAVDICLPPTWVDTVEDTANASAPLRIVSNGDTVIDLTELRGRIERPLSITSRDWRGSNFTMTKLVIGPQPSFANLTASLFKGFVMAADLNATKASLSVASGPVILSSAFAPESPGFAVMGDVLDGNVCIADNVTSVNIDDDACSNATARDSANGTATTATTVSRCPVATTWSNPALTVSTTMINVAASALYVDSLGSLFVNRLQGHGIQQPSRLDAHTQSAIEGTAQWASMQTFTDFVQIIDLAAPALGVVFQHTNRRIVIEIGAQWLGLYSATALLPAYRRIPAVLTHYGCPNMPIIAPTALLLGNSDVAFGTSGFIAQDPDSTPSDDTLRSIRQRTVSLAEIEAVSQTIVETAGGAVAFTAVETETGADWRLQTVARDDDEVLRSVPLTVSGTAIFVQVIAALTSVAGALFFAWSTVRYRNEILLSLMHVPLRNHQRKLSGYADLVPYHWFVGVLQISCWIAFNFAKACAEFVAKIAMGPPSLKRSLKAYYFAIESSDASKTQQQRIIEKIRSGLQDDGTAALEANKQFQTLPLSAVISHFEKWVTLRYMSNPARVPVGHAVETIARFGCRTRLEEHRVVLGLRPRLDVPTDARFDMTLSSLQLFFDVTDDPSDDVAVNTIRFLAFKEDSGVGVDRVLRMLWTWNLKVTTRVEYVVTNIRAFDKARIVALDEQVMYDVVERMEMNAAMFPSYGEARSETYGGISKWKQKLFRFGWLTLETATVVIFAFLPFLLCLLIAFSLDVMRSRYTVSSTSITMTEFHHALATTPGHQSPLVATAVGFTFGFIVVVALEAPLTLIAFRAYYRRVRFDERRMKRRFVVAMVRWVVSFLGLTSSVLAWLCIVSYVLLVATWWMLGAIIAPDRMLVYASAVFTFVYVTYTTFGNLRQLQQLALRRLEERIVSELLKFVRNSSLPASQTAAIERQIIDKAGAQTVTASMLLDLAMGTADIVDAALVATAESLGVPRSLVTLLAAFSSRVPDRMRSAIRGMIAEAKLPDRLVPVAYEMASAVVGSPSNVSELVQGLIDVSTADESTRAGLKGYQAVIQEVANALVNEDTDASKAILFSVAHMVSSIVDLDTDAFEDVYWAFEAGLQRDRPELARWTLRLATRASRRLPSGHPGLKQRVVLVNEALSLATGDQHNLRQAATDLLREWAPEDASGVIAMLLPLLVPEEQRVGSVATRRNRQSPPRGDTVTPESEDALRLRECCEVAAASVVRLARQRFSASPKENAHLKLLHSIAFGNRPPAGVRVIAGVPTKRLHHVLRKATKYFQILLPVLDSQHGAACAFAAAVLTVTSYDASVVVNDHLEANSDAAGAGDSTLTDRIDRWLEQHPDGALEQKMADAVDSEAKALDELRDADAMDADNALPMWIAEQWIAVAALARFAPAAMDVPSVADRVALAQLSDVQRDHLSMLRHGFNVTSRFMRSLVGPKQLVALGAEEQRTACATAQAIVVRLFPEIAGPGALPVVPGMEHGIVDFSREASVRMTGPEEATNHAASAAQASTVHHDRQGPPPPPPELRRPAFGRTAFLRALATGRMQDLLHLHVDALDCDDSTVWIAETAAISLEALRLGLYRGSTGYSADAQEARQKHAAAKGGAHEEELGRSVRKLLRLLSPEELYGERAVARAYSRSRRVALTMADARMAGLRDDIAEVFVNGRLVDFSTVAGLFDVDPSAVTAVVDPAGTCAEERVLEPLLIFARILQGTLRSDLSSYELGGSAEAEAYSRLFPVAARAPRKLLENVMAAVGPSAAGGMHPLLDEPATRTPKADTNAESREAMSLSFQQTRAKVEESELDDLAALLVTTMRRRWVSGAYESALRSVAFVEATRRLRQFVPNATGATTTPKDAAPDDTASAHRNRTASAIDSVRRQTVSFNVEEIVEAVRHVGHLLAVLGVAYADAATRGPGSPPPDLDELSEILTALLRTVAPALFDKFNSLGSSGTARSKIRRWSAASSVPAPEAFLQLLVLCDVCLESDLVCEEATRTCTVFSTGDGGALTKFRAGIQSLIDHPAAESATATYVAAFRTDPAAAFRDVSPFTLAYDQNGDSATNDAAIATARRHRFGSLAGIPLWYDPRQPTAESALTSVYVCQRTTPVAVLRIIADMLPRRHQTRGFQTLLLAGGRPLGPHHSGDSLMMHIFRPDDPCAGDLCERFLTAASASHGRTGRQGLEFKRSPMPWLAFAKALASGNPFALVPFTAPVYNFKGLAESAESGLPISHVRAPLWFAAASNENPDVSRLIQRLCEREDPSTLHAECKQLHGLHADWRVHATPPIGGALSPVFDFVATRFTTPEQRLETAPLFLFASAVHLARGDFDGMLGATESLWRVVEVRNQCRAGPKTDDANEALDEGHTTALTREMCVGWMSGVAGTGTRLPAATRLGLLAVRVMVDEGNLRDDDLALLVAGALAHELEATLTDEASVLRRRLESLGSVATVTLDAPEGGVSRPVWNPASLSHRFVHELLPFIRRSVTAAVLSDACGMDQAQLHHQVADYLAGDHSGTVPSSDPKANAAFTEAPITAWGEAIVRDDELLQHMETGLALMLRDEKSQAAVFTGHALRPLMQYLWSDRLKQCMLQDSIVDAAAAIVEVAKLLAGLDTAALNDDGQPDDDRQLELAVLSQVEQEHRRFVARHTQVARHDRQQLLLDSIEAFLRGVVHVRGAGAVGAAGMVRESTSFYPDDVSTHSGAASATYRRYGGFESAEKERAKECTRALRALFALARGEVVVIPDLAAILHIDIDKDQLTALRRLFTTLRTAQNAVRRQGSTAAPSAAEGMDLFEIVSTQIFNELDTDRRGRITFADFVVALDRMHISLSDPEKLDLFKAAVQSRSPQQQRSGGKAGGGRRAEGDRTVATADDTARETGTGEDGYLTLPEFQRVLRQLRQQFVDRMLTRLRLTDTTILVSVLWLGAILIALLTFFILGVIAFTDGTSFSAVISAAIPLIGAAAGAVQDPAKVQLLLANVDTAAESFFQLLASDGGS